MKFLYWPWRLISLILNPELDGGECLESPLGGCFSPRREGQQYHLTKRKSGAPDPSGHVGFFFNRHCKPCGLWPAQLSLNILSRKIFTECRCQWHVKPLTWRTFQLSPPGAPHVWNDASEPQQRKVELWARNFREFCRKWRLLRHFSVLLLYFPSEGRRAEEFFARKIRPGLNQRIWVPKASTLTSRPPKPLTCWLTNYKVPH